MRGQVVLALAKAIVDRCCGFRCLPGRDADLIEAFDDITDRIQTRYGGLQMCIR